MKKIIIISIFAFMSIVAYSQKEVSTSIKSETFINNNLWLRLGPTIHIESLDIYVFGELFRNDMLKNSGENFFSAGTHISYNINKTGTYLRIMGQRNFTSEKNYGYFLAMQSVSKKVPIQLTFLADTDKLICGGLYGDIYVDKNVSFGAWFNLPVNGLWDKSCQFEPILEFDLVIKIPTGKLSKRSK